VGLKCQRLRPDLALEVIDQAGHCPHDERPDAFHRVLIPWLARL
jgi:pimeloyl-ACP methyl ester carboxylesterase